MKTFSTSGTGNQQTLSEIETDKIPVYDSLQDVIDDLPNIPEGQLALTKDTGDELAQPVDVVEEDNLHAVTSNAVAEVFSSLLQNKKIRYGHSSSGIATGQYLSINTGLTHVDEFIFSSYSSGGYNVTSYAQYDPNNTGTVLIYVTNATAAANSRISWIAIGD